MIPVNNFTNQELEGLTDGFCTKLDLLRNHLFPFPIVVIVGHRSIADNAACGGEPNSPHLLGKDRNFAPGHFVPPVPLTEATDPDAWNGAEALDVKRPTDPFIFGWFMWALGKAGFTNIEVCPLHIHFSDSKYVPNNVVYQGIDH